MAKGDWIPSREQDLEDLQKKWLDGLANPVYKTQFGWNEAEITATSTAITDFHDARGAYETDNSTERRISKDTAKDKSIDAMRDFANTSIRFNKKMPPAYKHTFGIDEADTTYTSHDAPKEQPGLLVENTQVRFQHKLRALNPDTGRASKPEDADGVRYAWQVSPVLGGGEKPAGGEDLTKSKSRLTTSIVITHTEADKGKTVYYAACYKNSKGDEGPWSPVEEAIIG